MNEEADFYNTILNAVSDHIVVIREDGKILYVNDGWCNFNTENEGDNPPDWTAQNYLDTCDSAIEAGDPDAPSVASGIRSVIEGKEDSFNYQYPCHSPQMKRWYMMRVTPVAHKGKRYIVIAHQQLVTRTCD
jgi:PAS domain-containing protein